VVLPFTCPGSNLDDEYFADAFTDELITALTRVPGPVGHTWRISDRLRGSAVPAADLGRHGRFEICGSVPGVGARLR
jgi:TolB-like protein